MSHPRLYIFILMFSFVAAIAACGQTGDLYLPENDPKQKAKDQSQS